jgi:hypothetical protein
MSYIIKSLPSYYFAFGHFFIISDHPESAKQIAEHPEFPVITRADIESPEAEELLKKLIEAL